MITAGCLVWGVMTLGFSVSRSLREAIFFWAINGLGLSLVIPNVQVRSTQTAQLSMRAAITCRRCLKQCGWHQWCRASAHFDGRKLPWQAFGMIAHKLSEVMVAPCAECDRRLL